MNQEEAQAAFSGRIVEALSSSFTAVDWSLRDVLIDALAKVLYDNENAGEVPAWDQIDDEEWDTCAGQVEDYLPQIVAFVAEWLENKSESLDDIGPVELPRTLAQEWRKDMT